MEWWICAGNITIFSAFISVINLFDEMIHRIKHIEFKKKKIEIIICKNNKYAGVFRPIMYNYGILLLHDKNSINQM